GLLRSFPTRRSSDLPGIGSGHSAHPSRPPVGKPDQMMLLSVSRGSEPGSVGGGEFCIGSPSAFEFGEPGGFGSNAHRGPNEGDATSLPPVPEVVSRRHWPGAA